MNLNTHSPAAFRAAERIAGCLPPRLSLEQTAVIIDAEFASERAELCEALRPLIKIADDCRSYFGDLGEDNRASLEKARATLARYSTP